MKKRRYIGLDDEEEEDTRHGAKKRPDDGCSYDPSADFIYDARQYFDPEKYRETVRNRYKKAAKLKKRLKLRASNQHLHGPHANCETLKNRGYKSTDNGNSRGLNFKEGSERYSSGESQEDCAVTTHRELERSADDTFSENNGYSDVIVAKSIRHKAKHKHKSSKKSLKHSNLMSSPIEVKNKTHRKHSEFDDANTKKKKKRHKKKHGKSKRKDGEVK